MVYGGIVGEPVKTVHTCMPWFGGHHALGGSISVRFGGMGVDVALVPLPRLHTALTGQENGLRPRLTARGTLDNRADVTFVSRGFVGSLQACGLGVSLAITADERSRVDEV